MTWWHLPLQVHPLLSSDLILPLSPSTCCCLIGYAVSCLWASVCAHLTWPAPTCGLVLSPSSSPLGPLHKCHPAPLAEFPVYSLPQHTWVPLLCHLLTGWSLFKIWLPQLAVHSLKVVLAHLCISPIWQSTWHTADTPSILEELTYLLSHLLDNI